MVKADQGKAFYNYLKNNEMDNITTTPTTNTILQPAKTTAQNSITAQLIKEQEQLIYLLLFDDLLPGQEISLR
jgi:hypothetical protein